MTRSFGPWTAVDALEWVQALPTGFSPNSARPATKSPGPGPTRWPLARLVAERPPHARARRGDSHADPRAARHLGAFPRAVLRGRTVGGDRAPSSHGPRRRTVSASLIDGKIAELGTHDELVALNGEYAVTLELLAEREARPVLGFQVHGDSTSRGAEIDACVHRITLARAEPNYAHRTPVTPEIQRRRDEAEYHRRSVFERLVRAAPGRRDGERQSAHGRADGERRRTHPSTPDSPISRHAEPSRPKPFRARRFAVDDRFTYAPLVIKNHEVTEVSSSRQLLEGSLERLMPRRRTWW